MIKVIRWRGMPPGPGPVNPPAIAASVMELSFALLRLPLLIAI
jgi:hypothetical protein